MLKRFDLANKPKYKWVILVVCFMMEFVCLGFCSSNAGMYLTAITSALGFERSLFSLNTSFRYIVSILLSLWFGALVKKFGVKKLVYVGLATLSASTFLYAFSNELYQFYLAGALLGAGVILTGSTMAGTIIRQWFDKDVGKYTGIALSANGIGGALAAQVISPIINNGDPFGYRGAYVLSGVVILVFSIVIVIFLKEPVGKTVSASKSKKTASWEGLEYNQVLKKSYFYCTAAMIFFSGICLESISHTGIAHLTDSGIDAEYVAAVASVSSLILTVAKIVIGILYDKKGLRFTMLMCHTMMFVAYILIVFADATPFGKFAGMAAMVLSRLALPLETVMIPLMSGDMFGNKSLVSVMGVFVAVKSAGSCVDAPICNLVFDLTGSYVPIYIAFGVMMVIVTVLFQLVITAAYKDKKLLEAKAE